MIHKTYGDLDDLGLTSDDDDEYVSPIFAQIQNSPSVTVSGPSSSPSSVSLPTTTSSGGFFASNKGHTKVIHSPVAVVIFFMAIIPISSLDLGWQLMSLLHAASAARNLIVSN